jgi:hypothetical protein
MTAIPADVEYIPGFVADPRSMYSDLLEEFFAREPEQVLFGGSRISGMAFRNDRPNSFTQFTDLERRTLSNRLWCPMTGVLAGQVAKVMGILPTVATFNFYRDGEDFIDYHCDLDGAVGPHVDDMIVATVSFGVARALQMRRIDGKEEFHQVLAPGSLFIMRGHVQHQWMHAIPKSKTHGSRLSITFFHHQLDPPEQCLWVLNQVDEALREIGNKGTAKMADLMRNYSDAIPVPVLVGPKAEVFEAWCRRDWRQCICGHTATGTTYTEPQAMLDAHAELQVPEDSTFTPSTASPSALNLEHVPLDSILDMLDHLQREIAKRRRDVSS